MSESGIEAALPYIGGGGGFTALGYLFWRVLVWSDNRTRGDNKDLRAANKELQGEVDTMRDERDAAKDLAASYKRRLITAGNWEDSDNGTAE